MKKQKRKHVDVLISIELLERVRRFAKDSGFTFTQAIELLLLSGFDDPPKPPDCRKLFEIEYIYAPDGTPAGMRLVPAGAPR